LGLEKIREKESNVCVGNWLESQRRRQFADNGWRGGCWNDKRRHKSRAAAPAGAGKINENNFDALIYLAEMGRRDMKAVVFFEQQLNGAAGFTSIWTWNNCSRRKPGKPE